MTAPPDAFSERVGGVGRHVPRLLIEKQGEGRVELVDLDLQDAAVGEVLDLADVAGDIPQGADDGDDRVLGVEGGAIQSEPFKLRASHAGAALRS